MPSSNQKTIRWLFDHGYFFGPTALEYGRVRESELAQLKTTDRIVQAALIDAQDFNGVLLEQYALAHHGRLAIHDGLIGPATKELIATPRCGEPDFYDPAKNNNPFTMAAVGSGGNWPRCHGIGNYHAANINVTNQPPAHLRPHFAEVIRRVTEANRQIGLQLYWGGVGSPIQDGKTGYQLTVSFVGQSPGWIGYAQVSSNMSCSSQMWSRYLSTYMRSSSAEAIIRQWAVLFLHELGHNMGTGHTRGGIMNPSILSLPASWMSDVLLSWLKSRYGGIAVPKLDNPDEPDTPPPDGSDTFFRGSVELVRKGVVQGSYMLVPTPKII